MKNIDFIAIANAIKAAKARKNGPVKKVGGESGKEMQESYNPMLLKTYQAPVEKDMLTANRDITRENYMAPSNVRSQGETKISYKRGGEVVPETGEALKKRLVKDGIMIEKEGTLQPTEKYEKLKREGGLYKYRLAN